MWLSNLTEQRIEGALGAGMSLPERETSDNGNDDDINRADQPKYDLQE